MKVIDDVISENFQINLENLFLDSRFEWYLNFGTILDENYKTGFEDTPQFIHQFISDKKFLSNYLDYVMDNLDWENTLSKLSLPKYIIRMKSNLLLSTKESTNPPHIDFDLPHTVMIYYVNDSDGPTVFFKKEGDKFVKVNEVEPKRGRFLIFNGNHYHASTPPTKNNTRCVINFNLTDHD